MKALVMACAFAALMLAGCGGGGDTEVEARAAWQCGGGVCVFTVAEPGDSGKAQQR